jgi:hypothetical protein
MSGKKELLELLIQCVCEGDKLRACNEGQTPISISARQSKDCPEYSQTAVVITRQKMAPTLIVLNAKAITFAYLILSQSLTK